MYNYCGKKWSEADLERIRSLIAAAPQARRSELARQVCAAFAWRRINGQPNEMSCRVAMIRMCRDGLITLPPPSHGYTLPRRSFTSEASDPKPLIEINIVDLVDLKVDLVARGKQLALWNELISRYHYLGYRISPGAQQRYFITGGGHLLGVMGFGGAAWKVAPRDSFIGWTAQQRQERLHLIVNQTRFLILPWVRCHNLATKALALVKKRISADWRARYGYAPVLLETFVDKERFSGTCYKAGNWLNIGLTQGRSRMDRYTKKDQPIKSIWLMPMTTNFRETLLDESGDDGAQT